MANGMNGSGTVSVALPSILAVAPMKNVAELGDEFTALNIDLGRVPENMIASALRNGFKYYIDAALTHRREQNKKAGDERNLNEGEAREVFENITARFYDPEWKPRTNGAEPMSDLERATRELIRTKFYDLKVIQRANKKTGQEAVTLEDFLADFESTEQAVRSVAADQIRAAAPQYDGAKVQAQVDASWNALQAKAAKLVKTWEAERKLKAASAKTAEGDHVLDF